MSISLSNYDKGIEELSEIVSKLEKDKLTLDESIKLYKRGLKLHKELLSVLEKEEGKIFVVDINDEKKLVEKNIEDGQVVLEI